MLNGAVGLVIRSFEFADWLVVGIDLVVEATVGEWSTQALVEEQQQECDLYALGSELVGVPACAAFRRMPGLSRPVCGRQELSSK